mmetsp:Transcript_21097/g.53681  ORF Transcript_21097/g.53681 Transcript_21097/m.53681 type:complete len:392 (-) Transcript_21097:449-1624(-)
MPAEGVVGAVHGVRHSIKDHPDHSDARRQQIAQRRAQADDDRQHRPRLVALLDLVNLEQGLEREQHQDERYQSKSQHTADERAVLALLLQLNGGTVAPRGDGRAAPAQVPLHGRKTLDLLRGAHQRRLRRPGGRGLGRRHGVIRRVAADPPAGKPILRATVRRGRREVLAVLDIQPVISRERCGPGNSTWWSSPWRRSRRAARSPGPSKLQRQAPGRIVWECNGRRPSLPTNILAGGGGCPHPRHPGPPPRPLCGHQVRERWLPRVVVAGLCASIGPLLVNQIQPRRRELLLHGQRRAPGQPGRAHQPGRHHDVAAPHADAGRLQGGAERRDLLPDLLTPRRPRQLIVAQQQRRQLRQPQRPPHPQQQRVHMVHREGGPIRPVSAGEYCQR